MGRRTLGNLSNPWFAWAWSPESFLIRLPAQLLSPLKAPKHL